MEMMLIILLLKVLIYFLKFVESDLSVHKSISHSNKTEEVKK